MEVPDGVPLELLLRLSLPLQLREPADPIALEAPVERGAREVGDRRPERVETVVKGEQRVLTEGHDGRFLLDREHGGAGALRPHRRVVDRRSAPPLRDDLTVDPMALSEGGYGLLAPLDGPADGLRLVWAQPWRVCPIVRRGGRPTQSIVPWV